MRWKIIFSAVLIFILVAIFGLLWPRFKPIPLEEKISRANTIACIGETFPPDGGSREFLFRFANKQGIGLCILVRHRNPNAGGNLKFQEIWLCENPGYKTHIDLQPQSALERKLLELTENAALESNALPFITHPATKEGLTWLRNRVQDRSSKW